MVGGLLLFCWQKNLVSKFAAALPEAVPLRAYSPCTAAPSISASRWVRSASSWVPSRVEQQGLIEFKERWGAARPSRGLL